MQDLDYIDFPKAEHSAYQERLQNKQMIYTIRVSKEVNKYHPGRVYNSPFGELKVVSVQHFQKLDENPFYNELTKQQIKGISKYIHDGGYDLIGLEKV